MLWTNSINPKRLAKMSQRMALFFLGGKVQSHIIHQKKTSWLLPTLDSETIQIVPSFKFIWLHFDKNLIWKYHIIEIKTKCSSNLLKTVAAQKWGADFTTLRQLNISHTLSKISFAAPISSSYPTHTNLAISTIHTCQKYHFTLPLSSIASSI